MKKLPVVIAMSLFVATSVNAQSLSSFGFQVHAVSLNAPGGVKSVYGAGYGGGAHLDMNIALFGLRIAGDYYSFGADFDAYRKLPGVALPIESVDGGRVGILTLGANGKIGLPLPVVSPYVTVGLGIARLSASDLKVKYTGGPSVVLAPMKSRTGTFINVGGGADVGILLVTVYIEVKYVVMRSEGESVSFVPVTLGVTF